MRPGAAVHADLGDFCRYLVRQHSFRPGTVVDVGVADGTIELYTPFRDARLLLVEPVAAFEPALEKLCARFGGEYVLAAASEARGEARMHVPPDAHAATLSGDAAHGRTVKTIRLDEEIRARGLPPPYFLKADTQGTELDVIAGAEGILPETAVIVLETSLFHFAAGRPDFGEVVEAMHGRGYVVYDLFGGHGRPLDGALAQVDVAFVAEDSPLRADHRYMAPEQAQAYANSLTTRLRRWLGV